jgi:hypothetical protein
MADIADLEKTTTVDETQHETHEAPTSIGDNAENSGALVRPKGWIYKEFKLGPLVIPWYASPKTQLFLVALVCFLCPGMFNVCLILFPHARRKSDSRAGS